MNQMKNLPVPSVTSNVTLTSAIQSSQTVPSTSYLNDYEITDTITQSTKKSTATIAAFPPRTDMDNQYFSSKTYVVSHYERDTPPSIISNEDEIRFGTTPGPQTTSITPSAYVNRHILKITYFLFFHSHDDDWDAEKSRQYYLDPRFTDPFIAGAE
jgi:hypothetical protein